MAIRQRPFVWLACSIVLLALYGFSIGWRSEWTIVRGAHIYESILADGRFAFHTRGVPNWADQSDVSVETVSWSLEVKLLPRIRRFAPAGLVLELPLWLIVLPVCIITFVKWRRSRPTPAAHECATCRYDLRESAGARCPECGAARQPTQRKSP